MENFFKKPYSFILILVAIVLAAIICIYTLPVKMYPDMVKPKFYVSFGHTDIGLPTEIYKTYGRDLETQIKELQGLEKTVTSYHYNRGQFRLEFEWDSDEEEIEEKLKSIMTPLKSSDTNKFWYRVSSSKGNSSGNMMIAVSHKSLGGGEIKDLLENQLEADLIKIDNVAGLNFWGRSDAGPRLFL